MFRQFSIDYIFIQCHRNNQNSTNRCLPEPHWMHLSLMADVQSLQNETLNPDSKPEITDSGGTEAADAAAPDSSKPESSDTTNSLIPPRRPTIECAGPVATSTARRIACGASLVALLTENDEPLSIGRKSRIWTPAMRRAILARDRHCRFPGCDATRHLDIHHRVHWVDGGETSVNNGISLYRAHHVLVHEGGYHLEHMSGKNSICINSTGNLSSNNHSSSNNSAIRRLLPSRSRFRIINSETSAAWETCD
jgi:hypothetical protein